MTDPLTILPNELLLMIASKLTKVNDIVSLILASKHFAAVLTPALHKIALQPTDGTPALHWAASSGHTPLVRLILEKGEDVDIRDESWRTSLHIAADRGTDAIVSLLIENGADVNALNSAGHTPLHEAAYTGTISTARILLCSGADVNVQGICGTPLHQVLKDDGTDIEMLKLLLEYGADVNAGGLTAKMLLNGTESVVQDLLWEAGWHGSADIWSR